MILTLPVINPEILLLLGFILILSLLIQQQNKKLHGCEKRLKMLKSDIQALLLCSRGVGNKLNYQQNEFKNLIERQDRLELTEQGDPAYRQAMALLDRGASQDEMIDTCDLTQAEVELITQLRQTRQTPGRIELVV